MSTYIFGLLYIMTLITIFLQHMYGLYILFVPVSEKQRGSRGHHNHRLIDFFNYYQHSRMKVMRAYQDLYKALRIIYDYE
jgi:hypothetical protein